MEFGQMLGNYAGVHGMLMKLSIHSSELLWSRQMIDYNHISVIRWNVPVEQSFIILTIIHSDRTKTVQLTDRGIIN